MKKPSNKRKRPSRGRRQTPTHSKPKDADVGATITLADRIVTYVDLIAFLHGVSENDVTDELLLWMALRAAMDGSSRDEFCEAAGAFYESAADMIAAYEENRPPMEPHNDEA